MSDPAAPPRAEPAAKAENNVAFWTMIVGAPTAFSVLRLWVEAGGDLQATLLLVSHVGPLNLIAALFATVTKPVTIALVTICALGGMMRATASSAPAGSWLREHPSLAARIHGALPRWFIVMIFVAAALTWEIFYLGLLAPAAVATAQVGPWRLYHRRWVAVLLSLAAMGCYWWVVGPAVADAWRGDERLIAGLLLLSPLVSFGIAGPLPEWFARGFATVAQVAILWLVVQVAVEAVNAPILPVVVTEVSTTDGNVLVRGHVINVNDTSTVILQEQGGVQFVPNEAVKSMVLCGTPREIPAFTTRVRDYHVEDSLLSALGRHRRPRTEIDPICRASNLTTDFPLRFEAPSPAPPVTSAPQPTLTVSPTMSPSPP